MKTGKALKITPEQFKPLEDEWKKVSRQTRLWLWKLDASLPGKLGKFGDWLNQAEEILAQEEEILENPEEMAAQLTNILAEHKVRSLFVNMVVEIVILIQKSLLWFLSIFFTTIYFHKNISP